MLRNLQVWVTAQAAVSSPGNPVSPGDLVEDLAGGAVAQNLSCIDVDRDVRSAGFLASCGSCRRERQRMSERSSSGDGADDRDQCAAERSSGVDALSER